MEFAQETERSGYLRSAQVINEEILTILYEIFDKSSVNPEVDELRSELAENSSFTGPSNGVMPNCEAIRIVQPDLDIPNVVKIATAGRWDVNRNIFLGIKAAQQGEDHDDEVSKYSKNARSGGVAAIRLFYSALINGTRPIPDEAKPTIACIQAKTEAAIDAALAAIFEEIRILAKAVRRNVSREAIDEYVAEITAAHKKASDAFNVEIDYKFSVVRNLGMYQYLNKTGTLSGLFAIESAIV